MQSRKAYIESLKKHLDELDVQLSEMEYAASQIKEEAKENYHIELAKLQAQAALVKASMDNLKDSSEKTWKTMTAQTEHLHKALVNSFAYFKSQF